jgi:hypothetical protein
MFLQDNTIADMSPAWHSGVAYRIEHGQAQH